jgi:dynein heavy chain
VYGPPPSKTQVIFVDDLNMPQLETYGAQPPIEILRQYMDHGGWYDRENAFRKMVDVQFVCAMGPPGGGRNPITSRYLRHFNTVSIVDFNEATLQSIFSSILDWYLSSQGFPADIKALKGHVIAATLEVYNSAIATLLPTPSKSHYVFNLRDFSRVVGGMLLQSQEGLNTGQGGKGEHIRLWTHEVLRVFYDRLVDDKDRGWFLEYMKELTARHFKIEFDKLFEHLDEDQSGDVDAEELRKCFFGAYITEDGADGLYDEVTDIPQLIAKMEEYLVDFNGMSKRPMNLAMFLYAVEHVSRICRVLKQPGAHMLNVGVGGSGRQSLSRLAAFISGMEVFQIEISKSYTKVCPRPRVCVCGPG